MRLAAIHLSLFEQQIHRGWGLQKLDRVLHQITSLRPVVPAKITQLPGVTKWPHHLPGGVTLAHNPAAAEAVEAPGLDPLWRLVR